MKGGKVCWAPGAPGATRNKVVWPPETTSVTAGTPRFRKGLAGGAVHFIFKQHGVDVAFQVIHAHQGFVQAKVPGLCRKPAPPGASRSSPALR